MFAYAQAAEFFYTAFGVDVTTCIMGIFLADRSFYVVAVKETCKMISGLTFFGETLFLDAVTAFPSGCLGTVIGMSATMG